jgi:electron transfer flavoprotein beta subunit
MNKKVALPCVITADLRLNDPRYPALPAIMKAKKKPLEVIEVASLGIADIAPRLVTVSVAEPPKREGGVTVENVDDLLAKLKGAGVLG